MFHNCWCYIVSRVSVGADTYSTSDVRRFLTNYTCVFET